MNESYHRNQCFFSNTCTKKMSKKHTFSYVQFMKMYDLNKDTDDIDTKIIMRNIILHLKRNTNESIQHIKKLNRIEDRLRKEMKKLGYDIQKDPFETQGSSAFGSTGIMVESPIRSDSRFGSTGLLITSPAKN